MIYTVRTSRASVDITTSSGDPKIGMYSFLGWHCTPVNPHLKPDHPVLCARFSLLPLISAIIPALLNENLLRFLENLSPQLYGLSQAGTPFFAPNTNLSPIQTSLFSSLFSSPFQQLAL